MATEDLPLETLDQSNSLENPITIEKKPKRQVNKRINNKPNGKLSNGHSSPSVTTTTSNGLEMNHALTPMADETPVSIQPKQDDRPAPEAAIIIPKIERGKFQSVDITASDVDADEDQEHRMEMAKTIDSRNYVKGRPPSISTTDGMSIDQDVVEIHQFSLDDVDAYLTIYFEVLHNRLRSLLGSDEEIERFRVSMKTRLTNDINSREYQSVLLGKIHDQVVAAAFLSFPGESSSIPNDRILVQPDSCFTPIRRWMVKKANYVPTQRTECYIEMLGVKSEFQNRGIGAAMLECVENFAQQGGAHVLTIHANNDRLKDYFERFGFLIDNSDSSAWWKWIAEHDNFKKMCKLLNTNEDNTDGRASFTNASVAETED